MKPAAWKFELLDAMSADTRLTATDFRVAYRLLKYADADTRECFPAQETIADDLGLTDRGVRLAVANLRRHWLRVEPRPLPKGRGKSNFYRFGRHEDDATTGTTTGTTMPVEDATIGTAEQDFRKSRSGAPLEEEPFELREPVEFKVEARKRAPAAERGTYLPPDFQPDLSVALDAGMTKQQATRCALNFVNYWNGVSGQKGRKRSWDATWRLWVSRDADKLPRGNGPAPPKQTMAEYAFEKLREALDEQSADDQIPGLLDPGKPH